jgi:hypothetical protein
MHVIAHGSRNTDAAHKTLGLKARGDIHSVAVQVRPIRDHVTDVDADTEADAPVGRLVAVVQRNLLLHLHRALHRTVDAVERNQQGVAAGLHQPAAEFANCRIDQRATERTQPLQCTGNIEAYQAAVADHVGRTRQQAAYAYRRSCR